MPPPWQSPRARRRRGAVPGGVGGELPSIFRAADLTPLVLLLSLATAAALGAGHALTPGHGKTLMAAYLVGTRGTPVHAVGLGLSVTLSHTLGILVLAALVVGAQGLLPPDVVVRAAPLIAAVSIVAIGGWMLVRRGPAAARGAPGRGARRGSRARSRARSPARRTSTGHAHDPRARRSTATAASTTATSRRRAPCSAGAACSCSASPAA